MENGVNGSEDVEMVDDGQELVKPGINKEGDDEMTVVVPPPKGTKLSGDPNPDEEGDIVMENAEKNEIDLSEAEKVDPKVKAITGQSRLVWSGLRMSY